MASARMFFTAALAFHGDPAEVITDRAPALANAIEELVPTGCHNTGQYQNNRVDCDHGRLKARLRPMRGLRTERTGERGDPRPRRHPEPASWPLRACSPRHAGVPVGHRNRPTQTGQLISADPRSDLSMARDRTTQQSPLTGPCERTHGCQADGRDSPGAVNVAIVSPAGPVASLTAAHALCGGEQSRRAPAAVPPSRADADQLRPRAEQGTMTTGRRG
jgi:hypothetical protein